MQRDPVAELEEGRLGLNGSGAGQSVVDQRAQEKSHSPEHPAAERPSSSKEQKRRHDWPERVERRVADKQREEHAEQPTQEPAFTDPTDSLWSLYLAEADKEDAVLVESWKGDTDGILIFTGLFAATVATLVTQTYQLLSPPVSSDTATDILLQISQQISGLANGTRLPAYSSTPVTFNPPFYAIWVNALWFLSLSLSLASALMATLMQQWTRRYLRAAQHRSIPHLRGPIHVALRLGTQRFGLDRVVGVIVALLHLAVYLFFAGLLGLLFNLNTTVAHTILAVTIVLVLFYVLATILPLIFVEAPYDTPVTPPLQHFCRLAILKPLERMFRALWYFYLDLSYQPFDEDIIWGVYKRMQRSYLRLSRPREANLHARRGHFMVKGGGIYAMQQALKNVDESWELHRFLDAFLSSFQRRAPFGDNKIVLKYLFDVEVIAHKITDLILSCRSDSFNKADVEPSAVRVSRMRTVLSFFRQDEIKLYLETNRVLSKCFFATSYLCADENPFILFSGRILVAHVQLHPSGFFSSLQTRRYAKIAEDDIFGWDAEPSTERPRGPLDAFLDYTRAILHFASFENSNNPVPAYRTFWEPLLHEMKDAAISSLREDPVPISGATFCALLDDAGLGDLLYPSSRPTPGFLASWKRPDCTRSFAKYPVLVDALRAVAEACLPLPPKSLHSDPEPQPESEADYLWTPAQELPISATETEEAPAPLVTGASVLFGPLTWHQRPVDEFRTLMRAWEHAEQRFEPFAAVNGHAFELLHDCPVGDGHARIRFVDMASAERFVEVWTRHPPAGYGSVVARIWDGGGEVPGRENEDRPGNEKGGGGDE
ncbi:hypothetical protein K488DRAFT_86262 [Vararia minispora EC-137]|uniref:Uncharacterized protein n=1 Tax=Vararia minispora EC-137 TaxID=1314806 RepID=A0ACB8QK76_9AGAM|nr:hypothetical protein K488DRAFT_86262 [Vararia minispora EC-137]